MKRLVLLALLSTALFVHADDSPYLENTDKVELEKPLLRVSKPAKEWTFMNLQVLKKQDLARAGSAKGRVEDAYQHLKAQLNLGSASANFYVYAWTDDRKDVTSEKIGGELLEQCRGCFKDKGKVASNGKTAHGKLEAWGFEVEGKLEGADPSSTDETHVAKLAVFRPSDKMAFVLSLELPKKKLDAIRKDKKKLFSPDVVKLQ